MKKIGTKILLAILINSIVIAITISGISLFNLYKDNQANISQVEEQLRESYDLNIEHQVEILLSSLEGIQNQLEAGVIDSETALILSADIIRSSKYGEGGYFWADTIEGDNVVLLGREDIEGTNRLGLTDKKGTKIIQEFIQIIEADGQGYLDYYFNKPNESEALPKRGYIKLFEPYNWIIGTGNYIDEIDDLVLLEESKAKERFIANVVNMIIALAVALIIGVLIAYFISKSITKPIKNLILLINKTADLNVYDDNEFDFVLDYKDETGLMAKALGDLRVKLRNMVVLIKDEALVLGSASKDMDQYVSDGKESIESITVAVSEFADGAGEQAIEAQNAVEKMTMLATEIKSGVDRSDSISTNITSLSENNQKGKELILVLDEQFNVTIDATDALNGNVANLSTSSSQISEITNTIQSVAEQTNLLALNAAIEAARAGEAGRGFAVVAEEIRKLAEQTTHSTSQIESLIDEITTEINSTITNMKASKNAVDESNIVMEQVKTSFDLIEVSRNETFANLNVLIENIINVDRDKNDALQAIQGISAITEQNAASSQEIAATMDTQNDMMDSIFKKAEELGHITNELNQLVEKFQI